jgi:integrase
LERKVEEKRLALDRFRKDYDIVSMERNENRTLRKLSGLSDSLNKANEEKVAAQARLGAIRAAISQGRPVVDSSGQDGLTNLEQRLVEIQEQLKELEDEFTPRYMSVDPKIKGLQRKRELLEQEIRNKRHEGQQATLAGAEQDYASARQAVASLRRQLDEHKQQTMEFTTRFAEHEALQEELLQLETAYREVQDQQLQMQVHTRSQYLQVRLKEPAFLPERPGYPDYARDAGISVAASLMAALLLLFLYDFLTRPARHSVAHDIKQVFMTSPETRVLGQVAGVPLPQPVAAPALEQQLPRELSQAEVEELFRIAGPDVRLLIVCLLSGLTAFEVSDLQWSDIDKDALVIHVSGKSDRAIVVTPPLLAAIEAFMPAVAEADSPVWQDADGKPLPPDDLAAMLLYSAHDAGLTRPPDVTPEAIRHTYIAFLVRKGVRLNDLARLAGHISSTTLAAYGVYSPPGSAVPLDSVESIYPALQSFYQHPSNDGNTPRPEEPT